MYQFILIIGVLLGGLLGTRIASDDNIYEKLFYIFTCMVMGFFIALLFCTMIFIFLNIG